MALSEEIVEALRSGNFLYADEAILQNFGETASKPRYVEFVISEEGDKHPFKGQKCGRQYGQRVALIVVPIDDEEHVQPTGPENKRIITQAAMACQDSRFWDFVRENFKEFGFDDRCKNQSYVEVAADFVRAYCNVSSRRDLTATPEAAKAWAELYRNFQEATGQVAEKR
jgi:hypothetical protein